MKNLALNFAPASCPKKRELGLLATQEGLPRHSATQSYSAAYKLKISALVITSPQKAMTSGSHDRKWLE